MHSLKRPKPGDTEEELLKQEKEFLESLKSRNISPAAKVIRVKKDNEESSCGGDVKNVDNGIKSSSGEDEQIEVEPPAEAVLFEVKERKFDATKLQDFSSFKALPRAPRIHRSLDEEPEASGSSKSKRKKSLFARSFDSRQEMRGMPKDTLKKQTAQNEDKISNDKQIEGEGRIEIGDRVHPYLAGMTADEILEEQRKLIERLDPRLVEFIRNRGHQPSSTQLSTGNSADTTEPMQVDSNPAAVQQAVQGENICLNAVVDDVDLPINPRNVEMYPRMNKVEHNKLAWAGVVKTDTEMENVALQGKSKTARFDFKGLLIPEDRAKDPTTYDKALHNHGNEMERPGYSIEELLILGRSTTVQQRSIALGTLGNIYERAHTGMYDEVLEQPVFSLLDYMDFIYVIRKGLDSNDSSINSALTCLAALLYPESEEVCLDVTYLWPNTRPFPLLTTKPDEIKKDSSSEKEMKDFEFLQLDLLDFLISRTEIISRIEYLLTSKTELFNELGVISVLKILIRCARHSPSVVIRHEKLLKYITVHHISPNWNLLKDKSKAIQGTPLFTALKLVRVLIDSNLDIAMKLYHNYSVLPSVMSYLAYDQWRDQTHVLEVEDLVLESFRIWLAFLHHGIAIDEYVAFFPVLMQFLTFYGRATDLSSFDLSHSAHLFALLSQIVCFGKNIKAEHKKFHSHWNLVKDSKSLVEEHCYKLLKILVAPHLQDTYNVDLTLLSLGKGLEFLTFGLNYIDKSCESHRFKSSLHEFVESSSYMKLTSNLISHSVLLVDSPEKTRYPTNFASVDAVRWKGELNPMMQSVSPFHFLSYFASFCNALIEDGAIKIVSNKNTDNYLRKLQKHNDSADHIDYFVRFELGCLYELLNVLPKSHLVKFPVSYRVLACVPACCVTVFKKLLQISLQTCCKDSDVDAVYQFYLAYFFLGLQSVDNQEELDESESKKSTKVRFDDGGHPGDGKTEVAELLFENWTIRLAEAHWIFHPLENLYKRAVSTPRYVDDNLQVLEQEIRGCLSFIKHCLSHYCDSIIQMPQDLVTIYCRICRTFMLGTPNVYFDEFTSSLLTDILLAIVNGKVASSGTNKTLFSKYKPSKSAAVSFYDFYEELAREYFDTSYFNEVFASYLFLPLRSPEDLKVKSCFWNHEHIRCVRLSSDKLPIPVQYLTSIPEQNADMLMIFTRNLKRGAISKERNPFLYEVIVTHLKNSQEFMTDELRNEFTLLSI